MLYQAFSPADGVFASYLREHPTSLAARWRSLWFGLLLAIPVGLIVIAAQGYLITAMTLSIGLLATAAYYATIGTILFWLTRRWFRIRHRRMVLAEAA